MVWYKSTKGTMNCSLKVCRKSRIRSLPGGWIEFFSKLVYSWLELQICQVMYTVQVVTEALTFSEPELMLLADGCLAAKVSPRCVKRLVNVFKVLKLIWSRQDYLAKKTGPSQPVRDAAVWMLAMSASTSKSLRNFMREVFIWIEQNRSTSKPSLYGRLNFLQTLSASDDKKQFDNDKEDNH